MRPGGWLVALALATAAVAVAVAGRADACPACLPAPGPSPVQRLAATEAALGGRHGEWLASARLRLEPVDDAQWRDHVAFHIGYLEYSEPGIAEFAYVEVARAPYEAMLAHKALLDAGRIAKWLDDPRIAHRAPLYTLLLGIVGGPKATARIDRAVTGAHRRRDVTNLAALLVASMEVHGSPQVAWIERAYLADRLRSAPELKAVLIALQVQGGADAVIPRARAIAAYRAFVRIRHPLAGYAAPVLMSWKAWDAVPDYVDLLRSAAPQHPASMIALLHYLESAPGPEGKAAAAAWRARQH